MRARTLKAMTGSAAGGIEVVDGVISQAPASRTDPVGVALASQPDHTIAETDWWNRDGDILPAVGDRCLLTLSDTADPGVLWRPNA